ncbi:leucine-rich repeat domain-containing protein [Paenibacillus sp. GCM10012307]|uniref:Leucine-rich repeat protein n=1 Tax=Paenibacillus roseus TaxID=2798579 RepID=A0A934J5A2_9BACL|nr:leucine-rich repeat protein [Paenibacillus roseus]MBJ6360622.1 leucine-rich repeat protein [Paenibacillus roseus]
MRGWKALSCLIMSVLFIGIANPISVIGAAVTFADAGLEAAVRDALHKPSGAISTEDLQGLTQLQAAGRGIRNIAGLEYAVNLQSLNLSNNEISNIAKLGSLTRLETLILNGNQIASADALGTLISLKSLWLTNNRLTSVSALSTLTQLRHLYAAGNQIGSLTGLGTLTRLQELNLASNAIQDVSPLRTLTALQSLNLEGNKIAGVTGLEQLGQLQKLSLAFNPVSRLEPIAGLAQLDYLHQRGYAVSASSRQLMRDLESRGGIVDYVLVIPTGTYVYDVNQDGVANPNDINDIINFYLNINSMKTKHPEWKLRGNEIDPEQLNQTAYLYDVNRDGTANANDINDAINFYLNVNGMKTKHPEFKVVVP